MRRHHAVAALAAPVLIGLLALPAPAQVIDDRTGHLAFGAGFGFLAGTEEGTTLGFTLSGDYYLTQEVSIGPLAQVGIDDDFTLIGLSGQIKYMFEVPDNPALHPHVQAGLGFVTTDNRHDETDFLVPIGGGIDVELARNLWLGTTLLLNLTGLDDDLFLNWNFGFKVFI
ncbi:MAG: outer membrane beta-barrel protein [Nitrospirota bacterium]